MTFSANSPGDDRLSDDCSRHAAPHFLTPRPWAPALHCVAGDWFSPSPESPPALWLIHRQLASEISADLLALLSPDERVRHSRLRRQEDRERFLLGRGVLRLLLGHLLKISPAAVRLVSTHHGKPCLDPTGTDSLLQFNVAHSGDLILLGFHACHSVGVDLEQHQSDMEWQPISQRFFTPLISNGIAALPQAKQLPAFYQQWCRWEATIKAEGTGFATDTKRHLLWLESTGRYDLLLPRNYAGCAVVIVTSDNQLHTNR
jgi:4'-phosphopantetheinyl transferase